MTNLETVGAIVGTSAGVLGIIFAINNHFKEKERDKEKIREDYEVLRRELNNLKTKDSIREIDVQRLEERFNQFMNDMLKYFQIK